MNLNLEKEENNNFILGDKILLTVYGEICCELCNEIIHNHIDCPVCKRKDVETDRYCDLSEVDDLTCNNCKTTFLKVSEDWYRDCEAVIAYISKDNN